MPEPRSRRFTIWHAALFLPWAVASFGFGRAFNDNSYLWHVRAGDWQVENGSVLNFDPFSFTMAGEPWRTQSWLAELLYAQLDAAGGLAATPVITTICAALVFVLLGLVAYRRSKSVVSVVVYLVVTAVALAAFINPRPVIFSFPVFAAVVLADDDKRLSWCVPLLMWAWASVHGSFIIGLAYLTIRVLMRGFSLRSVLKLSLVGVPTLLTAHGIGIVEILVDFASDREAIELMTEWQTPDLLSPPFIPVFLAFVTLIWLAQCGKIENRDWLLLVPFMALAVSANRAVPPAWIGMAPLLGTVAIPIKTSSVGGVPAIALAVSLALVPALVHPNEPIDSARFPIEAARHLESERVFHDDAAGGWLIYEQWPDRLVYIDDRAELYGRQMVVYTEVRDGRRPWVEEFDRWGIDEALLSVTHPLVDRLASDGWVETHRDDEFVVLSRMNPG